MITTEFNHQDLYDEAVKKGTNVVRLLFDNHIYKMIDKKDFEISSRGHNNSMVQISDLGGINVSVRIKTKGRLEKIGNGQGRKKRI